MLELLAPAGDMEAFDVAVASGADAVYLGLDNFNARMKAQNFDCDNIAPGRFARSFLRRKGLRYNQHDIAKLRV